MSDIGAEGATPVTYTCSALPTASKEGVDGDAPAPPAASVLTTSHAPSETAPACVDRQPASILLALVPRAIGPPPCLSVLREHPVQPSSDLLDAEPRGHHGRHRNGSSTC